MSSSSPGSEIAAGSNSSDRMANSTNSDLSPASTDTESDECTVLGLPCLWLGVATGPVLLILAAMAFAIWYTGVCRNCCAAGTVARNVICPADPEGVEEGGAAGPDELPTTPLLPQSSSGSPSRPNRQGVGPVGWPGLDDAGEGAAALRTSYVEEAGSVAGSTSSLPFKGLAVTVGDAEGAGGALSPQGSMAMRSPGPRRALPSPLKPKTPLPPLGDFDTRKSLPMSLREQELRQSTGAEGRESLRESLPQLQPRGMVDPLAAAPAEPTALKKKQLAPLFGDAEVASTTLGKVPVEVEMATSECPPAINKEHGCDITSQKGFWVKLTAGETHASNMRTVSTDELDIFKSKEETSD
ncbi:hypothetical protein CYMTET_42722 [Cymbomonas tetramitiformis]|uniref:Transmembrane protein n=1 Tax=Cymbomonas tetramitiformis TaxID=36881 RepID=A0AAE0C4V9_9CHLO|nr:hypothetical protein CYMTET_42722 [Cymbomonas tetramitiformis]|eukprot:gene9125-10813_t